MGKESNTWWALLQPVVSSCREVIGTASQQRHPSSNMRKEGNQRVKLWGKGKYSPATGCRVRSREGRREQGSTRRADAPGPRRAAQLHLYWLSMHSSSSSGSHTTRNAAPPVDRQCSPLPPLDRLAHPLHPLLPLFALISSGTPKLPITATGRQLNTT